MIEKHQLTPVEHELMEILWKIEEGSVRDVIQQLSNNRKLAYTSVSTILRILQQKKILTAKKRGRQHIYKPILSREAFTNQSIKKMVRQVFSNDFVGFITYLVDQYKFSIGDINTIQTMLETKKIQLITDSNSKA